MSELVKIKVENHVADVRLNRPDKMNALNPQMFKAIVKAAEEVAEDKSVRAVVLSGEGRAFCAGLDFQSFASMESRGEEDFELLGKDAGSIANYAQMPGMAWKQVPVPVIAALHGMAFGGGLQIALGSDIRLAHPDLRMSVMEIKWGLVPDMSLTQTIRDLVRLDVAKELTFTGRIIQAEEAAQLGLVTRVCEDPLQAAHELAQEIALKSPDAIVAAKQLLESAWHSSAKEGLGLEASLQKNIIGMPNQIEAVKANFEKRAPSFKDRD